jgi:hypothetical protein
LPDRTQATNGSILLAMANASLSSSDGTRNFVFGLAAIEILAFVWHSSAPRPAVPTTTSQHNSFEQQ